MATTDTYLANPNLKKSGVQVEYTEEQVAEYIKCAKDIVYFIKKYVKIVNVDRGLVPFDLYPFQENMVNLFTKNRFVLTKMPRQSGKSTTVVAYMLWRILFTDSQSIAILANKGALAREMVHRIQLAYENLPMWMQQGIVSWNKGSMELENGSKIVAAATSSSAVRGGSYNLIFLDEFAFVPRNLAEDFFASVYPTISSGSTSQVIIVSTPNGMNHFYKMWIDALEGRSGYKTLEVHWKDVPGRDEKWRDQTIKNTSEEQFRQEFDCEFIGSNNTLINGMKLRQMPFIPPKEKRGDLDIFEPPVNNHIYFAIADTARGIGLDYSALTIFDGTTIPYKMVAKYRNKDILPSVFPDLIRSIATEYNDAFVLVENNDIGGQVADTLHRDLEYDNMIMTTVRGRGGQKVGGGFAKNSQIGVKTTQQVKRIGCNSLKELIENDKLLIEDFDTLEELASFVSRRNSFMAEEGAHDDLVMTCVLFSWLIRQEYFKEMTDQDVRKLLAEEKARQLEQEMLPFGFYDDGTEEVIIDNNGDMWRQDSWAIDTDRW
ncbi:MAG: terminase [Puniceicoccaceae bacterium TMED149]|nr:MAG: terminase [Puniceicoccaceae bacterium TMED149]